MDLFICFMLGLGLALLSIFLRRQFAEFPGQSTDDYIDGFPALDIRRDLSGKLICEGVIFGPLGRVTSSFVADFDVSWQDGKGVMKEHFRYNNGSTQDRQWTLTLGQGDDFTATADDVPGMARGRQSGSAVQMRYRIRLPEDAGGHVLDAIDWMYRTPDGTIINRSQFRKFGFRVAELVASIRQVEGSTA